MTDVRSLPDEQREEGTAVDPGKDRRRARRLTALGLGVFVAATVVLVWTQGLIISRDWLFVWLLVGLLAVSLADPVRWVRGVLFDWLPLMLVLLCYDLSLPVRKWLGNVPNVWPQLEFDRIVFGELPTLTLQRALDAESAPHWFDYPLFVVYMSHFFVTLLILALLWKLSYERFRHFRAVVVGLATAGFVTYVLFPAVPPWMAGRDGHIETVHRTISATWEATGIATAQALFENRSEFYNQEAAVPSLHAAFPMLIMLFFWGAGRWVRAGLIAYVLTMAFLLVYSGEHYVSDILLGWLYAAAVIAAVAWVRRRWARRPTADPASDSAAEPAPEPAT